jgi:hypothetical protein
LSVIFNNLRPAAISLCGGFSFSAYGPRRPDDAGAAPAPPVMGRLGPRFRARDIAGKIALVYAVALRPMARNEFGAILAESMIPKSRYRFSDQIMLKTRSCRTGRGKALNKDPFGHAYLHS